MTRRSAALLCALVAVVAVPAGAAPAPAAAAHAPALASAAAVPPVLARGFGSSRGFGSRSFGSRNRGFGGRRSRGHGIFRRILRGIAIGYLLHLLFTTPGGLIVLLMIIVLITLAVRRLRRPRYW